MKGFGTPYGVVEPRLAPPDERFFPQGLLLNWLRRPSAELIRPNDVNTYTPGRHLGRVAGAGGLDGALITLPRIGNIGQIIDVRLLVVEGRNSGDPPLDIRIFTFIKDPKGYDVHLSGTDRGAGDNGALSMSNRVLKDRLHIPLNNLENGGGFASVAGQLGGSASMLSESAITGENPNRRGCVIPIDGITLEEENLYLWAIVDNAYTPTANCRYTFTPLVRVRG